MKKILPVLVIFLLISACGQPGPATETSDLPAQLPPSPAPSVVVEQPTEQPSVEGQPSLIAVPTDMPVGLATPVCIAPEPVQADIDRALSFTGQYLSTPDWDRSYTVSTDRVTVSWFSSTLSSVAYLEAFIYPCGYEDVDLDNYFIDANWAITFGNYQSYERISECSNDSGLRLYQFKAVDQGALYDINFWAVNDTSTRVLTFMIVLPVESKALMEQYSYSLFPQLTSCN